MWTIIVEKHMNRGTRDLIGNRAIRTMFVGWNIKTGYLFNKQVCTALWRKQGPLLALVFKITLYRDIKGILALYLSS